MLDLTRARLIDLTAPIHEGMVLSHPNHPRAPVMWQYQRHEFSQWLMAGRWNPPETPKLVGLPEECGMPGRGHGVQSEHVLISTHMGTHVDSPIHLDPENDEDPASLALERCCGPALLLDVRKAAAESRAITVRALEQAEQATSDRIQPDDIVVIHTGHSAHGLGPEPDAEKWAWESVGVEHDAAAWFIEKRVKLVGIDSPNIDCDLVLTAHVNFSMRKRVGERTILIAENLAFLERIPTPRFYFMALPLPFVGASGSPVRAVAIVPGD